MRKVKSVIGVALVLAVAASATAKEWYVDLSLDEALKKAEKEKKLVFVDFYADWCGPCKMMDASTFKDPKVIEWLGKKTVPIKIEGDKNQTVAGRYRIDSFPTLVFLKPDGTEVDRLLGLQSSEQLLEAGAGILEGKDSIARAKEKLEKSGSNDPLLRMQLAQAYMYKGKHAEALDEYLRCLDEGLAERPEAQGLRPYLISEIMMLGQAYPNAISELDKRREQVRAKVLEGSPSADDIFTFAALNEAFHEPNRNVEAYDSLRSGGKLSKDAKQALARAVLPQLLEARRYSDIAADFDVMAAVDEQFEAAKKAPAGDEQLKYMVIGVVSAYYQVLVGLERHDDAAKVAKRLVEFANGPETYNALAWNGYLSGKPTQANVDQARKADELSNGQSMAIVDTLARVLHARGQKEEAVKIAEQGLKKSIGFQERMIMEQCVRDVKQ